MKNKGKIFWISIGIGVLILIALMLISNILSVGERLRKINGSVEIAFYVVAGFIVFFLIINPLRIIIFSPSFQIQTIIDKETRKNRKVYKKVARNIIDNKTLPPDATVKLKKALKEQTTLKKELVFVLEGDIKKELNKIIFKNAKTVLVSTAISQNGKLDLFTVLAVNLRMVKELVVMCGFRPSFKNLGKLSLNVLVTALIAEGLEDLDFKEIFPNSTAGFLADIPFIKPIMSSIAQGISNALLTLRIGYVTRRYLFSDAKLTKKQIRRDALKEAVRALPGIIKESLAFFPDRIKKLFRFKDSSSDDIQTDGEAA